VAASIACEHTALFLQHDENAPENCKNLFLSHRHLRIVAAYRTPPVDAFPEVRLNSMLQGADPAAIGHLHSFPPPQASSQLLALRWCCLILFDFTGQLAEAQRASW